MARRNRRRDSPAPSPLPGGPALSARVETGPDGRDFRIRQIPAARAVKTYRCPGCDHEIRSGTAHLVAWPADGGEAAAEDRRHWHSACWANRATRGPTRRWS